MTEFETKLKLAAKAVGQGKLSRRDFIQFAFEFTIYRVGVLTDPDSFAVRAEVRCHV